MGLGLRSHLHRKCEEEAALRELAGRNGIRRYLALSRPLNLAARQYFWRCIAIVVLALACGPMLSGCAIRLAPDYDRSIVDGLETSSEEAMTLFASVSEGVTSSSFSKREPTYNGLLGKLDALRLTAAARPSPQSIQGSTFFPAAQQLPTQLNTPTPDVLNTLVRTLSSMRSTDRSRGL